MLALFAFSASQVGTPGPANMALLATGARFGLRRALPFVAGVVVGKQLIIWPLGFGLLELAEQAPAVFAALKWASAAYICWLAWKVANMRLAPGQSEAAAPGFVAGLIVHPLNPKAWAMITTAFTSFIAPGTDPLTATLTVALVLATCQIVLHPIWTGAGELIAKTLSGHPGEKYLFWALAALTVLSVIYALAVAGDPS
ncbi:MAG: LysE family translocator [Rhodobacteraceae bacterium]|nr:LysE family translocator [Paracoccaceae bacterium]